MATSSKAEQALGEDVRGRLRDLVMRCPCAVLEGLRWSVLRKVYTERYPGGFVGASSLPAAKACLKDLAEFHEAPGDFLLRLTENAALSVGKDSQLGCWPLLWQRLSEIVRNHGSRWDSQTLEVREETFEETEVLGLLLGQLKPLLSRNWDSGFEERGLGFFNEAGQFVNLRKMKHFIAELLKWRGRRQELVQQQVLEASAVDVALEPRLALCSSQRHNDLVLCLAGPGPMTPRPTKARLSRESASSGTSGTEASAVSPQEEASTPKAGRQDLEKEGQRLRIENAELKKRLQFGSEFLKQENRRLRVENAELKKRLYFGPYAQGASASSVPIWVQVPVMTGCAASPSRSAMSVGCGSEQGSAGSNSAGSVTPIPQRFWVPLPSHVMSPTGQPWPANVGQLVAVQIPQSACGSQSTFSEEFQPRNTLSDTSASQVSSAASPDCQSQSFGVPLQGTDDRWVCIPSGIVERHKAQFETHAEAHEGADAMPSQEART